MYTVHEHIYQIKLIESNIEYWISHQFVSVNRVEYLTKTVANYWKSRGKPDEEFKRKNRIKKKQYLSHVWEACEMCQARNGSGGGRGVNNEIETIFCKYRRVARTRAYFNVRQCKMHINCW